MEASQSSESSSSKNIISCNTCSHSEVCKFKPDPYMGSSSGGFKPICGYEEYRKLRWELKAENCSEYVK